MKKTAFAVFFAGFAALSSVACGDSDEDADDIVGDYGTSIPAGMGGADPDPAMDVSMSLAADGSGMMEMVFDIDSIGAVTVTFDTMWEASGDGYSIQADCTSVDPTGFEEFGLSCEALAEELGDEAMMCQLDGDSLNCDDGDVILERL